MKVLSLFDGISCGRVALERAGIPVTEYHAFEIDKHAIKVSKTNYPDIVHHGSVVDADFNQFKGFDLVLGGSPCTNFSFSGNGKGMSTKSGEQIKTYEQYINLKENDANFEGQSFLYWEFIRALKEVNPKYFLLENVKMKNEHEKLITDSMGVEPILINSNLLSAQNRKRLYWTNIPNVTQPEDKGILLKDIVHENVEIGHEMSDKWSTWFKENATKQLDKKYSSFDDNKAITMTARQYANWNGNFHFEPLEEYIVPFDKTLQILDKEVERGKIGFFKTKSKGERIYFIHDKAVTLCGEAGGGAAKMGQYLFGCITPDRINKRQNGQRFNDGNKFYTLTAQDKHGILIEGYIRKLTPVECERLQTLPDGYTSTISNTQRYKALGNGWTVDVIAHILKNIND